jgi:S-formylglutathione hydrolase FrmB
MRFPRAPRVAALAALLLAGLPAAAAEPAPLEFRLTFDRAVSDKPFTGRVFVMLYKGKASTLRSGASWFRTEPFFAVDVKNWQPGQPLVVGANALGCPMPLSKLPPGNYTIQAVMDFDRGDINFSTADGNVYGITEPVDLDPARTGPVAVTLNQVYKGRTFTETDRVKLFEINSKLLTAFHGQPMKMRAGVVLPQGFADNPSRKYPVVYEVTGFGGDHFAAHQRQNATPVAGVDMIWVVLDGNCRLGHHVFADSANNGPVGRALVEELIPQLEARFRGLGTPGARFVAGHSSGGWSSLWLQVTYPDVFGGCWSTAPDPVDFRDFQRIDLYALKANMFTDADGKPRPLARSGDKPSLFYQPFSDMEVVMGRGGQLGSFEAVFSPRGADGKPRPLWDRKTGVVDPEVAAAWEAYDIRLVLERNWKTLGPKLAGKIHVYMGEEDTFYLDGATKLLRSSLQGLNSDAVVELFPGKNHGSLMTAELRQRISREMAEQFRKSQK